MLKGLTWEQFCWFSAVLGFLWYGTVGLLCYRREILVFLGRRAAGLGIDGAGSGMGTAGAEVRGDADGDGGRFGGGSAGGVDDSLMGRPALPVGVSVLGMDQVSFVAEPVVDRTEQVGLVADVVEELKGIFSQLEREAGGKPEFFVLLDGLKEQFGGIAGHPSVRAINQFVVENAPFEVSVQEMEGAWS